MKMKRCFKTIMVAAFVLTFTILTFSFWSVPVEAAYSDDVLIPIGAGASGTTSVTWDSGNNRYVLQYSDATDTVTYSLELGNSNLQKGLIAVKAQLNSNSAVYPVYWGGARYRNSTGTLMTPSDLANNASVSYTHSLANNVVTFTVIDTYQSVSRTKTYTYSIQGKTLKVGVNSNSTAGNNNYAGLQLDRSYLTTNASIKKISYADDNPSVMVDNSYFYSAVVDRFKSNCTSTSLGCNSYDANSVWCSFDTLYDKNSAGNVSSLNETFYVTLSSDILDTVYKTSKTASSYRDSLTNKVVFDLWAEGSGYADDNRTMKGMNLASRKKTVIKLYSDWKMTDLMIIDHQWQRYSYDINYPVFYQANPSLGTSSEFASWISSLKGFGYLVALHEDYWFMYPDSTNKYWNATGQGNLAKNADGSYKNAWNNVDPGVMSYAIRAEKMKYYSDLESTQVNTNYDPNATYLDVNTGWMPDNLNQISLDANAPDSKTFKDAIIGNKTLFDSMRSIYSGPMAGEGAGTSGRFDTAYAGYVDAVEREITDDYNADIIVDYELKHIRPLMANQGMGYYGRFFPGGTTAATADWNKYRAMSIAFGHSGLICRDLAGLDYSYFGKEYYMLQALQAQYLDTSVSVNTIEYWNGTAYRSLSQALKEGYDFKKARLHIVYSNGLNIFVNFDDSNWSVTYNSVSYTLDKNGWVAGNSGLGFLEYSCLKNGHRVDYVDCASYTYADARGTSTAFPSWTITGQKLLRKGSGDATAPVISNIKIKNITDNEAVITWTTDESSSSLMEYGATTSYGSSLIPSLDFVKDHIITLTGLAANTEYHLRVRSEDSADNGAYSGDLVLKTLPAGNSASAQFSSTQGTNNWYYQYWDGSTYANLQTWDAANSVWKSSSDANCSIGASFQHPGASMDSIRKWVAPSAGWIQVTGQLSKSTLSNPWDTVDDDDGLRAYISLNNDIVWQKAFEAFESAKASHDLTLYVHAGDVLYFRENRISTNAYDGLNWNPLIIYLGKTSYTASTDFSSGNGTSGWYYRSWDGTQYREMSYSGSSWSEGSAGIYNNYMVPSSTRDASRIWIATASGDIKITGTAKKKVTGGDGVIADIFLNSQSIWNKTIAAGDTTGYAHSVVIHVEPGDIVEFRVNRNTTSTSDDTTWDPTLAYTKPYYSVDDFGSTQGGNQWYYQKWNGSAYSDLTWNSGTGKWEYTGTYLGIISTGMHPETSYDAVRKWVAPNDGRVKVYGTIQKETTAGDGVVANVLLNSTQYWGLTIGGTDNSIKSFSYYITVHAGDAIYFRLNKNGDINSDSTAWKVKIEYSQELYKASDDFSSSQGLNGWYYQRLNSGAYYDISWDSNNNYWRYSNYCIISSADQHPETSDDPVRKWVAPFKGTVRIKGSTRIYTSGGDGVTVTIKQGSTTKWSRSISGEKQFYLSDGAFVYDLVLDVNANDVIYFLVNRNSTIVNDSTLLNPEITYTQKF